MNDAELRVETAMSEGHSYAAASPVTYAVADEPPAGQPFEALRFQVAQSMFDDWPCGDFPLNRMTCQLINSFAYTAALSVWSRRND